MKKYYCENEALNDVLVENGINLVCNEEMEIMVSDEDAARIEGIVAKLAPAAVQDYTLEDVTPKTYEDRLVEAGVESKSRNELVERVDAIVAEILEEDPMLWSINRSIAGYGTWRVSLLVNSYRFGNVLTDKLTERYTVTHNEDKVWTIKDFAEIIDDVCQELAYDRF